MNLCVDFMLAPRLPVTAEKVAVAVGGSSSYQFAASAAPDCTAHCCILSYFMFLTSILLVACATMAKGTLRASGGGTSDCLKTVRLRQMKLITTVVRVTTSSKFHMGYFYVDNKRELNLLEVMFAPALKS